MSLSECQACGGHIPLGPHASNRCESCGLSVMEPARPTGTPGEPPPVPNEPQRDPAQVLATFRVNLDWAIDCASLKLNRLRAGTSAYKTQAGLVRGLQEARGALLSEMGA